MSIISLRQMAVGQQGKIAAVEALGEMGRRIRDMGIIPGTTVSVVGRAPLRDPVALRISGVTISLRNSEADHISVDIGNKSVFPLEKATREASSAARPGVSGKNVFFREMTGRMA